MRKILSFRRNTTSVVSGVIRGVAFGATVAVTFCFASTATAQTLAEQLAPTASRIQGAPVSSAVAVQHGPTTSVNDAGYSVLSDTSQVEPAQYLGGGGLFDGSYGGGPFNPGCDVTFYGRAEALYLDRSGDKYFSATRATFMEDFDWELGARITVGHLWDCTNGFEGAYMGPFDWDRQSVVTGPGNLQSFLRPGNGYGFNDVDAFFDANLQTTNWSAELQSFEGNRRWWVWDVLSTMVGIRYIDYQEDYTLFSSGTNGAGIQVENIDNQMAGVQVGADMLYPTGLRCNLGFRGKAGLYANFAQRRSLLQNNSTLLISAGDSDTDWAGMFEFGIFGHYAIVPSIRLTAAYDFWWITGVATVPEQLPASITPATGTTVFMDDDVMFHGGSVGVEVLF